MKNIQEATWQIKDSIRKLYQAQSEKKEAEEYYKAIKEQEERNISNFMFCNLPKGQNSFEINLNEGVRYFSSETKLKVTRVVRTKIIWNIKKLKEKLDKKQLKKVIRKSYTVNDMEGLIKYLKGCGVDAKKFKKYIDVSEEIDTESLNQMYNLGEINAEDIRECYDIKKEKPYIKFTEQAQ